MLFRGPLGGGAASGKMGALVASHNKGGQYLRARTTPTNPATPQQQEVRNGVRTLSPGYSTSLTDAQRLSWQTYGENVTKKNRLGDAIKLSGIAHYARSNVPRIQAGLPIVSDAPSVFDLGDTGSPGTLTIGANASTGTFTYNQSDNWSAGGSTNNLLLYVSRPQNIGRRFFKGPFQLAATIPGGSTTGSATFTLPFPSGPTGTQRIFAQYRITRDDGRLSSLVEVSATP